MGKTKNCDNCRYPGDETAGICRECKPETFSNWQPPNNVCPCCKGKGEIVPQSVKDFEGGLAIRRIFDG